MSGTTRILVISFSFLFHQLISVIAVPILAGIVSFSVAPILRPFFSSPLTTHRLSAALTETPGFPIQLVFGFLCGFLVCWRLRQPQARWVWVLPVAILSCVFIWLPISVLEGNTLLARIEHFFGTGCQPHYRCFDQVYFTLPVITTLSYSLGAFVSLGLWSKGKPPVAG